MGGVSESETRALAALVGYALVLGLVLSLGLVLIAPLCEGPYNINSDPQDLQTLNEGLPSGFPTES